MLNISELLKSKIEATDLKKQFVLDSKDYSKKWADAIKFFQKEINKERIKEKQPPYPFMAIRTKLSGVREIDDLRWFYKTCLIYKRKKKGNTFSKCFFGALKTK